MKLVVWDDKLIKPSLLVEDDELIVLDWPQNHDFEVGDQVQYFLADDRVFVYRVTDVIPELGPDDELKCVTLTREA